MRKTLFHSNNFHCKVIVIVICLSFSYQVLQAQPGRLTTSDLAKLARATIRDDYGFMCGFVNLSDSSLYSCDLIYLRKLSKDVVILDGTTCCPETNICQIDNLPPVSFTPYSLILTSSIKSVLRTVAAR